MVSTLNKNNVKKEIYTLLKNKTVLDNVQIPIKDKKALFEKHGNGFLWRYKPNKHFVDLYIATIEKDKLRQKEIRILFDNIYNGKTCKGEPPPEKICNPKSGRFVKKYGQTGKHVLKNDNFYNFKSVKKTTYVQLFFMITTFVGLRNETFGYVEKNIIVTTKHLPPSKYALFNLSTKIDSKYDATMKRISELKMNYIKNNKHILPELYKLIYKSNANAEILSTLKIPIEHEHVLVQPSSFVETGIVESATAY